MANTSPLVHTYKMDHSSPATPSWDEYSVIATQEWDKLLANPRVTETQVQAFMEENVCFMPVPIGALHQGANNPLSRAVVTQPLLPGFNTKIPDFMYFTGDSAAITCVLVEIESPLKSWFTSSGQHTAEFTQAANQLTQWKTWFSDKGNVLAFENEYRVYDYALKNRQFRQHYVLVIGRRDSIVRPEANRGRIYQEPADETWMTFDRLKPRSDFEDAVTVKLDRRTGAGTSFRAIHVPPSLKLGPSHYSDYSEILDLDTAIAANKHMSPGRKTFLANRLPYWENWLKTPSTALQVINGADMVHGE